MMARVTAKERRERAAALRAAVEQSRREWLGRRVRFIDLLDSVGEFTRAWKLDAPRLLVSFLKRAIEPARPIGRGIKSTHAPSDNGEDRHARLNNRRTAGKWDTEQSNFQQQTPPEQRCWCPDLLQWND
jgi:hypothetical protein